MTGRYTGLHRFRLLRSTRNGGSEDAGREATRGVHAKWYVEDIPIPLFTLSSVLIKIVCENSKLRGADGIRETGIP
jgi:hypothetical protein